MNIQYSSGYYDALLDILHWFENGWCFLPYGIRLNEKILCTVLKKFYNEKSRFMREKHDFTFEWTLEEYGIDREKYVDKVRKAKARIDARLVKLTLREMEVNHG